MSEMFHYRTVLQFNREWDRCKRDKIPIIATRGGAKNFTFEYDFFTLNHNLNKESVEKVTVLLRKIADETMLTTGKKSVWLSVGEVSGGVNKVSREIVEKYYSELSGIIRNKDNWVPISI